MNEVNQAIYTKLQAGTALTALLPGTTSIYHMQPPDNTSMPYVIFNLQGGGDENTTPSRMKSYLYFIRGYSGVSAASAGSIDTQVDALLHSGTISVSGYTNFWLHREMDFEQVENLPNGEKAYMSGAFYRVRLDK
ncbi:MAG: DUF3168 domain-containing protein [Proteobacteria bacterium]|nr:DUF3168 domain-containing protein [Pseudomonadota bacterium]